MKPEHLREGFTTGTAAAAAASAAVRVLLGGGETKTVKVALPPFVHSARGWQPSAAAPLPIAVERVLLLPDKGTACASVVKDGGDDPDATHGMRIIAYASQRAFRHSPEELNDWTPPEPSHAGGPPPAVCSPIAITGFSNPVFLQSGPGIGMVTLPGLPVAVGEPAINPEPRRQIACAVCEAAQASGFHGALYILLSVPEGTERARRTLNARLGILGGISILGTRGIVRPYSHDAWTGTIEYGLSVAESLGLPMLLFSTGRRSERLGFALYPGLSPQACVQAADFAAFSLRGAARRSFARLVWACFPGKLLKLAQGLEWTHAHGAGTDMPMLAGRCRAAGGDAELVRSVEEIPTVAGAFALMAEADKRLHDQVLHGLMESATANMLGWLEEEKPGWRSERRLTMLVFSTDSEELLGSLEKGPKA